VLNKLLLRPALHEHEDASQRVLGVQALPDDSAHLARLLREDTAAEVRLAAAQRCLDIDALKRAWQGEADADVRAAIAASLGKRVGGMADAAAAATLLAAEDFPDAGRGVVADSTQDEERRRLAIAGMRDEAELVSLALTAAHASTRMAAAERVHSPEALRRVADASQEKDRGVARHARRQLEAVERHHAEAIAADEILAQAEALVAQPGPIVQAAIELERRWKALDLSADPERRARWDATGAQLQARFDREHAQQRSRADFQRRLDEWLALLRSPPAADGLDGLRAELVALRASAAEIADTRGLAQLDEGEKQLVQWESARLALADAEKLVIEAEQLAAGTPIDDAELPRRWQALDLTVRTPALTRRFEAALLVIDQRRLAYVRAAKEQEGAVRQQLHGLLHTAEQALAAGQLQAARTAADATRALKPGAGALPKPTLQRIGRLMQQLVELERWHSFGQHAARVSLCERAEQVAQLKLDPARLAQEVQKLRADWKALDQEHAGVPKSLWERFDAACEKAYAPAAQHFAQQAAQRKEARGRRHAFIDAAAAHASTLMNEPRDWRAIGRWLHETDQAWHGGDLGSVDAGSWKKIDAQLRTALAPLRAALADARKQAKAEREALVAQAVALATKASERDAPAQVRALQAQWKAHATGGVPLSPRDERVLWEQFRAACDAVFGARDNARKQSQDRKQEQRRSLEVLCEELEQLAAANDMDDAAVRRAQRDLQARWKSASSGPEAAVPSLQTRFRKAVAEVDAALAGRRQSREAEVLHTLLAKEQLCEQLDALVIARGDAAQAAATTDTVQQRWSALPALAKEWDQHVAARRDAALHALADEEAGEDYLERIENERDARGETLIELELLLGLETPAELRAQRLAVQVKQLRQRFKSAPAGAGDAAIQVLLRWCATPGIAEARDHERCERIVASLQRRR